MLARVKLPWTVLLVLLPGMLAVSSASILVRWNKEAPDLTIALYRMAWASLLLLPFYVSRDRSRPRNTEGRHLPVVLAGCGLALHFAFWISSLRHTSVAVAVLLGNMTPVLVSLGSRILFKERLTRATLGGILLATCGAGLLGASDLQLGGTLKGALLALAGAGGLSVYVLAGSAGLRSNGFWDYVYPAYVYAAVLLAGVVLVSGEPVMGFGLRTHLLMLALAAGPQCIGHTSYNYALKYLTPTLVSLLLLAEPIGASLLAFFLLGESIPGLAMIGCVCIGWGIFVCARAAPETSQKHPTRDIGVAILKRGEFFYVQPRRDTGHLDGLWEFPGGKRKDSESPLEAASREAGEECGFDLTGVDADLIHTQSFSYPDRDLTLYFYLFDTDREPGPHASGEWVAASRLQELEFPAANEAVLKLLQRLSRP